MMKIHLLILGLAVAICLVVMGATAPSGSNHQKTPPLAGKAAWHLDAGPTKVKTASIKPLSLEAKPALPSARKGLSPLNFNYASNCTVYVEKPVNALYDWLVGDEIYYAYQDLFFPNFNCDTIYPFIITHIGMTLALNDTGTILMQVFVCDLDPIYSSPVCPVPGEIIYLSDQYAVTIPGPDVYSIMIALEQPVPVYGPYFACVYYGNDISNMYPGIAIDTTPYLCINYNDWGEGLTDLAQNDYYNFPGSIHLFSIGYTKVGTTPQPHFIIPPDSGTILPGGLVWVAELRDTFTYQSCKFEYFKSGTWYAFGADFDGTISLRNGVSPATNSPGWSTFWQPFGLPEGNYLLRASIADFDSSYASDTAHVYLDLKPLDPKFVNRTDKMSTCGPETVAVTIQDESPVAVTFGYRNLPSSDNRSLQLLKRNDYGDANGNPNDGNHEANGEYGEYYSAPAIFASFLKYWYDKGYVEVMANGASFFTIPQLVEYLAGLFKVRSNRGTEDDDLVYNITQYLKTHGGRIVDEVQRRPSWEWFKSNYAGKLATVAFAIRNPFGHWLAVQNVDYLHAKADSVPVTFYDPIGGVLRDSYLLVRGDSLFLGYLPNNTKYPVDLGISLHTKQETITYLTFGTDFDGSDGFKSTLPYTQFQTDLVYLVRARALNSRNQVADSYWMMTYHCQPTFKHGDADNSGSIDISDAFYIVNYIFGGGPTPRPVRDSGDANCDGTVDVSDAVFLLNYIFGNGAAPCP